MRKYVFIVGLDRLFLLYLYSLLLYLEILKVPFAKFWCPNKIILIPSSERF